MLKSITTFTCIFWYFFSFGYGQIKLDIDVDLIHLMNNANVRILYTSNDAKLVDVVGQNFTTSFSTLDVQTQDSTLWVRFKVINESVKHQQYYLIVTAPYASLYLKKNAQWEQITSGYMTPYKELSNSSSRKYLNLSIPENVETEMILQFKAHRLTNNFTNPAISGVLGFNSWQKEQDDFERFSRAFSLVYLSGLFVSLLFIFMIYAGVREKVYLYYMFCLVAQVVLSLTVMDLNPINSLNIIYFYPIIEYVMPEVVLFIFIGLYIFFIIILFELEKGPLLKRVAKGLAWLCFAYALFNLIFLLFFAGIEGKMLNYQLARMIIMPINFILIIWIVVEIRHPLLFYFIISHLFFFVGAILSVYIFFSGAMNNPESVFYFAKSGSVVFQMGLFGEVISFSVALSLRVKYIQKEKRLSAEAYIEQLHKNKMLQEKMNEELDNEIQRKTNELEVAYADMEAHRKKEIEMSFSKKLKEMEMMALRSQMNPHFLFNSMNALKHLILTERADLAMDYLDDFSVLLRKVLQNSKHETISVEDELDVLERYLNLEKLRLDEGFQYSLEIENRELLSQYNIPPLLLQPFAENAIWHGLIPSDKKEKLLNIKLDMTDELVITIEDNGIGRAAAKEMKNQNSFQKSMGLKITEERLQLFNQTQELKLEMKFIDLNGNGFSSGTAVTFSYKNE